MGRKPKWKTMGAKLRGKQRRADRYNEQKKAQTKAVNNWFSRPI